MGLMGDVAEKGSEKIQDHDKRIKELERVGEFIQRNAKGDKLGLVAKVGRKLVDFSKKADEFFASGLGKRLLKTAKSPILNAGQHVIAGMKLTTGVGDPDTGDRFGAGADLMSHAGRTLTAAFPDDSWDSTASSAYSARNDNQLGRTETVIGADNLVVAVLARESEQIAATRENLDAQSDWLADMSLVTMATGVIPYVGQAAKVAAEIAMVSKAVGASTTELMTMQHNAAANAAELQRAVQTYAAIAQPDQPATYDAKDDVNEDDAKVGDDEEDVPGEGASGAPSAGAPTSHPLPAHAAAQTPPGSPSMQPATTGGSEIAGVMAGAMSAILGPLGGILGGVTQAAAGAAQAATQAAGDPQTLATPDPAVERPEKPGEEEKAGKDGKPEKSDADPEVEDVAGKKVEDDKPRDDAGRSDHDTAKTLPPDLGAGASGSGGGGRAPAHFEPDVERDQLRVPVTVRLDPVNPGSTAVTRT